MLTDTKKAYLYILAKRQTEERIKVNWERELYECGFDTEWVEYAFATLGCTKEAFNKICAEWDLYLSKIHKEKSFDSWNTDIKAKELWVNSTKERMKGFWEGVMAEGGEQEELQEIELVDLLPHGLKNDESLKIFQKAINDGIIVRYESELVWKQSKSLLAYFADVMSEKFCLGKGVYGEECMLKVSWKPFEVLFNQKGLAMAKKDYQREGRLPLNFAIIDKLFEA